MPIGIGINSLTFIYNQQKPSKSHPMLKICFRRSANFSLAAPASSLSVEGYVY